MERILSPKTSEETRDLFLLTRSKDWRVIAAKSHPRIERALCRRDESRLRLNVRILSCQTTCLAAFLALVADEKRSVRASLLSIHGLESRDDIVELGSIARGKKVKDFSWHVS